MLETNPWNPHQDPDGAVSFSYYLAETGPVEFRIFTLIGEEVFAVILDEGDPGTESGVSQILRWDGRNNQGDMVLNGVYVALLRAANTGEDARLKIAVVK
jgi:hypothetical protein